MSVTEQVDALQRHADDVAATGLFRPLGDDQVPRTCSIVTKGRSPTPMTDRVGALVCHRSFTGPSTSS